MNERNYQMIFDELSQYLFQSWEKLIVYLEYGEGYNSISFYEKINNQYLKCYDMPGVAEEELDHSFAVIDKVISKERGKMKDPWTNMTMVVDRSGKMRTDYDYTDLSEGAYRYLKQWKKKYLL